MQISSEIYLDDSYSNSFNQIETITLTPVAEKTNHALPSSSETTAAKVPSYALSTSPATFSSPAANTPRYHAENGKKNKQHNANLAITGASSPTLSLSSAYSPTSSSGIWAPDKYRSPKLEIEPDDEEKEMEFTWVRTRKSAYGNMYNKAIVHKSAKLISEKNNSCDDSVSSSQNARVKKMKKERPKNNIPRRKPTPKKKRQSTMVRKTYSGAEEIPDDEYDLGSPYGIFDCFFPETEKQKRLTQIRIQKITSTKLQNTRDCQVFAPETKIDKCKRLCFGKNYGVKKKYENSSDGPDIDDFGTENMRKYVEKMERKHARMERRKSNLRRIFCFGRKPGSNSRGFDSLRSENEVEKNSITYENGGHQNNFHAEATQPINSPNCTPTVTIAPRRSIFIPRLFHNKIGNLPEKKKRNTIINSKDDANTPGQKRKFSVLDYLRCFQQCMCGVTVSRPKSQQNGRKSSKRATSHNRNHASFKQKNVDRPIELISQEEIHRRYLSDI